MELIKKKKLLFSIVSEKLYVKLYLSPLCLGLNIIKIFLNNLYVCRLIVTQLFTNLQYIPKPCGGAYINESKTRHDMSYRCLVDEYRVATVREKVLENEKISRSGKSQGITFSVREI